VTDTSRGTTIESNGVKVSTIEHVMSALWTLGVDNALIDIDAAEAPIMDGSAREYAEKIVATGLVEQDADRKYYQVTEKMVYTIPDKGVSIILYPDEEFSASVHVDYNSKVIGNQYATFLPDDDYAAKIAPCRTFVFLHELEPLFKMNLIKGGDLDNAIVVVENPVSDEQLTHLKQIFHKEDICITGGYLNNLELRFTNELARHKLLDLLGDLALLGMRIKGRVWASRPGHFANTEFMKQLRRTIRKEGERPRYKYDCRKTPVYDINDIRRMLPHRPPFLLVDRIFHVDDNSIAGIKNVTMNEPFFVGHFPNEPVMPGVLIVEADGAVRRNHGAAQHPRSGELLDLFHEDRRREVQAQDHPRRYAPIRTASHRTDPARGLRDGRQGVRGRYARLRGDADGAGGQNEEIAGAARDRPPSVYRRGRAEPKNDTT